MARSNVVALPKQEEQQTTQPGKLKLLMTPEDVAYALSVSRTTIYEMLQRGEIPSMKVGRARRIPLAWLETYIAEHLEYAARHNTDSLLKVPRSFGRVGLFMTKL